MGGTIGFGVTPLLPPGKGERRDYAFSLDGNLSVAFGKPVTITAKAEGFLYKVKLAQATLVYKIPNQVTLDGEAEYDLGLIKFTGHLGAIIDPKDNIFGGRMKTEVVYKLHDPFPDLHMPGLEIEFNNSGFAAYIPFPGFTIPVPPFSVFGTISYRWGDKAPTIYPYQKKTGKFAPAIPPAGASSAHAHAAAAGFTVPAHAPTASIVLHGSGGAPSVVLVAPGGQRIALDGKAGSGENAAAAVPDPEANATYVGIQHPRAGSWSVEQAPGSSVPIAGAAYSIGQPEPRISAKIGGERSAADAALSRVRSRGPRGRLCRTDERLDARDRTRARRQRHDPLPSRLWTPGSPQAGRP